MSPNLSACQRVDNTYRLVENVAIWNHSGYKDWPWISLPCDELPSWFAELKSNDLIRMDKSGSSDAKNVTKECRHDAAKPTNMPIVEHSTPPLVETSWRSHTVRHLRCGITL